MKKNIVILFLVSFTFGQANSSDDNTLNEFIGAKTSSKTTSKYASSNINTNTAYKSSSRRKYVANTRYNKKTRTYFINFDRPNYIEVDKYKNYNKGDLSKDYIQQMNEEKRKKDTL